jgi:hypothetical protein
MKIMLCSNLRARVGSLVTALLVFPSFVLADVTITGVTVNPGSVVAGNTIDVTVDATTAGGGGVDNWEATNITLTRTGFSPIELFCEDMPDFDGDGNYSYPFPGLVVPGGAAAGVWTVRVRAYVRDGDCAAAPRGNDDENTSETLTVIEPECTVDADCDDGLFCNGTETCDAGLCADGQPPDCDDGVSCTLDSCDEDADSCVSDPIDSVCDDGQFCNGAEYCDAIDGCQAGTPPSCEDDLFCNGIETCDEAEDTCVAGTPPDCDDGVGCTLDSCDEDADSCVSDPIDSVCDDGQFCNGAEFCDAIDGCQAGTPPDCDDDLFCNGTETCDEADDTCVAGTPPDVDDGVFCTDDYCDEENDEIVNDPNDDNCNQASNECSEADTCDPVNDCQFNNVECGSVTSSSLCEFDVEPTKGTCFDGDENLGQACSSDGDCDIGTCEQTDQFRLGFSPDMQNWVAYKQNSSNPGQFYYNVMYQMEDYGDYLVMQIPYPFVTQGAMPVHVYDANIVPSDEAGCLDPQEAFYSVPAAITMEDWRDGASVLTELWYLECPPVIDPSVGEDQWCELGIWIDDAAAGASEGFMYVNVHLDYGLKGPAADGDGDGEADRYDRGGYISPWGSSDALENDTDTVWIADCSTHEFSHESYSGEASGDDSVENLNAFKKPAGAFGTAFCDDIGSPLDGWVGITPAGSTEILAVGAIDDEGYFGVDYGHKGKPSEYRLHRCTDADCSTTVGDPTPPFWLQSKGFVEIHLVDEDTDAPCDGSSPDNAWSEPVYASGKFK